MWQITSIWGVITAVSTAITAVGVFFAFWELKEIRKARRIEALNTFLEIREVLRKEKFGDLCLEKIQ